MEAIEVPAKGSPRSYLWDSILRGFGVMVTDGGVRSYLVQYRIGGRAGKTRRYTIGQHGSPWTADKARDRAAEVLEEVRRKIDPLDAERARVAADQDRKRDEEEKRHAATRLAFSKFADTFVDRYAKVQQPKTWKDTESVVRRDLKPFFKDKPVPAIKAGDVIELIDTVQERGDGAALKAYKALRSIFGFAIDKHHIASSPMANIKPPAKMGVRDRTLDDEELRLVWIAAGELGWPFCPIVRLLILLGQRRDETAGLAWPEIDKAKRQWLLPADRSKNGKPNLVQISEPAFAIIEGLPVIKSKAKLLFSTTGETPVSGFSKVKKRLDAAILALMQKEALKAGVAPDDVDKLAVKPWTFHDLRRTLATGCQKLGIKLEVTESILNHISGTRSGIVGVYQVYKYEDEKRAALEVWGRHVLAIVQKASTANVVKITARAN
ncbi:MAG: integrase arm-type DNA-binding domain-containing protein [Rhizorhabdus sp.]|uniref:tyrosine-type recombinase/integrase n=1 Tax=Rhizorhabdus sp. TaxID=1968843 RepID=UPI001B3CF3C9|nr:integrase arm-type DNA-binding domain-containing protein [Rhizorhabdus sp.]